MKRWGEALEARRYFAGLTLDTTWSADGIATVDQTGEVERARQLPRLGVR